MRLLSAAQQSHAQHAAPVSCGRRGRTHRRPNRSQHKCVAACRPGGCTLGINLRCAASFEHPAATTAA
eukprot:5608252-Prymnesium_polylepis.1